jgi:hypothetical protein
MSDLVEKVARDIALADEQNGFPCYEVRISNKHTKDVLFSEARAAIKAVAEWSMSNYYAETSILRLWTEVLAKLEGSE